MDIKIDFKKWDLGGKIMFVSSCIAVFSFLLPWVDVGLASRNAFSQLTFLLGGLYLYPLLSLLNNKPFKKWIGMLLGIAAIVVTGLYIYSKQIEWLDGQIIYVAGLGAYLFILTSIGFLVGQFLHKMKH